MWCIFQTPTHLSLLPYLAPCVSFRLGPNGGCDWRSDVVLQLPAQQLDAYTHKPGCRSHCIIKTLWKSHFVTPPVFFLSCASSELWSIAASVTVVTRSQVLPCSTSTVADTKWEKELLNKTLEPIKVRKQRYSTTSLEIQRLWRAEWVLREMGKRHETGGTVKRKGEKMDGDNEEDRRRVWRWDKGERSCMVPNRGWRTRWCVPSSNDSYICLAIMHALLGQEFKTKWECLSLASPCPQNFRDSWVYHVLVFSRYNPSPPKQPGIQRIRPLQNLWFYVLMSHLYETLHFILKAWCVFLSPVSSGDAILDTRCFWNSTLTAARWASSLVPLRLSLVTILYL